MQIKRVLSAVAVILVMIMLSSCSVLQFKSAENLVRPPKLSGVDGELQAAFEKAVKGNGEYILKYPAAGQYRSAFIRHDCDGDGQDEAFVFYSPKLEEMSVYMYMLDYENGMWTAVGESKGEGNDVYSIDFCDLNGDGIAEVLVGWSSIDTKSNKKLSVYCSYKNSQNLNYRVLIIEPYTAMHTLDIDSDGEKEILIALINSTSDTYTTEAKVLKMDKQDDIDFSVTAIGQIGLYSEITSFLSVSSGRVGNMNVVYIDEAADDTYLTELLYWDSEKKALVKPLLIDVRTVADCPTVRSAPLTSRDIDDDGKIEIPATKVILGSSIITTQKDAAGNEIPPENIYLTSFLNFNGEDFVLDEEYIENKYDNFRLKYSSEKMKDITMQFYPDEHISQFFKTVLPNDGGSEAESTLLFTIRAVAINEDVSMSTIIHTGREYKYICDITPEGETEGFDKEYIASVFMEGDEA